MCKEQNWEFLKSLVPHLICQRLLKKLSRSNYREECWKSYFFTGTLEACLLQHLFVPKKKDGVEGREEGFSSHSLIRRLTQLFFPQTVVCRRVVPRGNLIQVGSTQVGGLFENCVYLDTKTASMWVVLTFSQSCQSSFWWSPKSEGVHRHVSQPLK